MQRNKPIFSPSMMCVDCQELAQQVRTLEAAGATRLHLDVMDGVFVPNFALGLGDLKAICRQATVPTELHLMIRQPARYIDLFADTGVDIIYIHPEADYHPASAIQRILERGKQPGIVLSPGTSVESVVELLHIVRHVLVMGVNPGHAGQLYLPYVDHKLNRLLAMKKEYQLEITMDGACSAEKIQSWYAAGVDGFVLGTAALFGRGESYQEIFRQLRALTQGEENG